MRYVNIRRKDGKSDIYSVYDIHDYPYEQISQVAIKDSVHKTEYIVDFGTFDIENSSELIVGEGGDVYRDGWMYVWQFYSSAGVCIGRTWEEWQIFIEKLAWTLELNEKRRFVIYSHNLGHEFQFARKFMGECKVFAAQHRKPIRVNFDSGIEMRCSWKLSNMSLEKFSEVEKECIHPKAVDDLDYDIIRYPWTELTDIEIGYCASDVISLHESILSTMHSQHDNLITIPMTSTGYVRRDIRRNIRKHKNYRQRVFNKCKLTPTTYGLLKETARGGDTHANRLFAGRIQVDVDSYDVTSSYPFQLMTRNFPMSQFTPYGDIESMEEFNTLRSQNMAFLFRLTLVKPDLKDGVSMPYISKDKCNVVLKGDKWCYDNGRIIQADLLQLTVTDVDYDIIMRQYDFEEMYITDLHTAIYGQLPEEIKEVIMDYFRSKCELAVKKKENGGHLSEDDQYIYDWIKRKLNAIFGMMYTDPVHDIIPYEEEWGKTIRPDVQEALDKFHKSYNSFLYYAWGVWCTAWARLTLNELIQATDTTGSIYCDTDSSKCLTGCEKEVDALNDKIKQIAIEHGAYCKVGETTFYMGVYEKETKNPHEQFITIGAKKYAYVDCDGDIAITVSGVNKFEGAVELMHLKNFKKGFVFKDAGGLDLFYNDFGVHTKIVGDKHFTSASNIAMFNGTYTLGLNPVYGDLIGYEYN